MRNRSRFASFHFEAKNFFWRNRRALVQPSQATLASASQSYWPTTDNEDHMSSWSRPS
jgi:hypothetical protein